MAIRLVVQVEIEGNLEVPAVLAVLNQEVEPFFLEQADLQLYWTTTERSQLRVRVLPGATLPYGNDWLGYAYTTGMVADVAGGSPHLGNTVRHEIGHLLELDHNPWSFMSATIPGPDVMSPREREAVRRRARELAPRNIIIRGVQAILRWLRENR